MKFTFIVPSPWGEGWGEGLDSQEPLYPLTLTLSPGRGNFLASSREANVYLSFLLDLALKFKYEANTPPSDFDVSSSTWSMPAAPQTFLIRVMY